MTQVTIDNVTTGAWGRNAISPNPPDDVATVSFTPSTSDGSDIYGYRVVIGGTTPDNYQNFVAGQESLFPGDGLQPGAGLQPKPVRLPSGVQITESILYSDLFANAITEGDHIFNVWAVGMEGWNA